MTLFSFSISNTVILNIKGENLTAHMKDLLTICLRAIIVLKINNIAIP